MYFLITITSKTNDRIHKFDTNLAFLYLTRTLNYKNKHKGCDNE